MLWVVDASVTAKWFIPEEHKNQAAQLLRDYISEKIELIAPDLLVIEMGNLPRTRCKRGDLTPTEAADIYVCFWLLKSSCVPHPNWVQQPFDLHSRNDAPFMT